DEMEGAVRRPFRLEDRFRGAAGDQPGGSESAVLGDVGDPQLGADPRHIRVVPAQPGKPTSLRRQFWRGVEIVALREHRSGAGALQIDPDERVLDPTVRTVL